MYFRSRLTVKFPQNESEHHFYMKINLLKDPLSDTFAASSTTFNICTVLSTFYRRPSHSYLSPKMQLEAQSTLIKDNKLGDSFLK